jgi:hypothetical protein
MADHITHDPIYNTVDRDDFEAMIQVARYNERTDAFDGIIAATHDHFWDPTDPRYVDFDEPFDFKNMTVMPTEFTPELSTRSRQARRRPADRAGERGDALGYLEHPARRAGRALVVREPVPHPARPRVRRSTRQTRRAKRRAMSPASAST